MTSTTYPTSDAIADPDASECVDGDVHDCGIDSGGDSASDANRVAVT